MCVSGGFVFFRVIAEGGTFKSMTATAAEDTGELRPFHDQSRLLAATRSVLLDQGKQWDGKVDRAGRLYVEASFERAADVLHVANTVLMSLGFDDLEVSCPREMKGIYDEFAIDGSGEDIYLSDGMWMTADGRRVDR